MKYLLLLISIVFFSLQNTNAQEIDAPLPDAITNEFIPEAPSINHTWVKGHWKYHSGKFSWIEGSYVKKIANHKWVDGHWVENPTTKKWTYQDGFWEQQKDSVVYNGTTYKTGVVSQKSVIPLNQTQNINLNKDHKNEH